MSDDEQFANEHERGYMDGRRAAFSRMLQLCLSELGPEERDAHSWALERADVVRILREACADFGDNEWEDSLHLGDVIEKHLLRHLEDT